MDRTILFEKNLKCDYCNKNGAYDFMGNYICFNCYKKLNKKQNNKRKQLKVAKNRKYKK